MNAPSRSVYVQGLETCIGILRFRKGPQDLPASNALLLAVIAGGVLFRLALLLIPQPEPPAIDPMLQIVMDIAVWLGGIKLALYLSGHVARFNQAATAVLGCQLVLAPLLLPASWLLITYGRQPGMGAVAAMIYLFVALWMLAATVRIMRSATEWPVGACVAFVLGMLLLPVLVELLLASPTPVSAATPAPA